MVQVIGVSHWFSFSVLVKVYYDPLFSFFSIMLFKVGLNYNITL
jgi:monomeric isocitrate dehydrogenase